MSTLLGGGPRLSAAGLATLADVPGVRNVYLEVWLSMHEDLEKKWREFFQERCAYLGEDIIEKSVAMLGQILHRYLKSGLADTNFSKGLASGNLYTYRQRLAEMLLYDRLVRDGFQLRSKDEGPDFIASKGGKTVCIELTTPEPGSQVAASNVEIQSRLYPDPEDALAYMNDCLLRVTGSLREKKSQIQRWNNKGVLASGDVVVIVVNEANLWPEDLCLVGHGDPLKGQSGEPLVLEAAYGRFIRFWRLSESGSVVSEQWKHHLSTFSRKPAPIPLGAFIGTDWSEVSGFMSMNLREEYVANIAIYSGVIDGSVTVHNDNADNPLASGLVRTANCFRGKDIIKSPIGVAPDLG
ncbi:hypothetical protein [Halomonas sp. KM-1]|uniref:hypothetical protein n=1 Tax=Halomonas sp. KM-1 TaxID=590061 RepID=UPI0011469E18|nr:hypothetical protein [Halomonas sp. KM-1]